MLRCPAHAHEQTVKLKSLYVVVEQVVNIAGYYSKTPKALAISSKMRNFCRFQPISGETVTTIASLA
jgi:hypothetical protein